MQPRLAVAVTVDGERADIDIDPSKTVCDLVQHALVVLEVSENPAACHLEGNGRRYFSRDRLADLDLDDGTVLALRLPL